MLKTNRIKFNLRDRGYKSHGQPRNFNVPLIVGAINSEATQERVSGRSMLGYYGHWPRIKFGHLTSVEGGIEAGKPSIVEPALVTTYLRAQPDGTIEHEAEFLDTDSGKVAARLHSSRAGGFSSVIDEPRAQFIGLDYVLEPNFRNNRGYTLDSATAQGQILTLDDAYGLPLEMIDACIADENLLAMGRVLDSAARERETALEMIRKLEAEREQLLDMLARRNPEAAAVFDSASYRHQAGLVVDMAETQRLRELAASFDSAELVALDKSKAQKGEAKEAGEKISDIHKASALQRFTAALRGNATLG